VIAIDVSHDCESGGGVMPGAIPVQRKASSACCGARLAEGGTDEAGFTCTGCAKPTVRTVGQPVALWTCVCGERRQQIVTEAEAAG
jgi:hypothetical protein